MTKCNLNFWNQSRNIKLYYSSLNDCILRVASNCREALHNEDPNEYLKDVLESANIQENDWKNKILFNNKTNFKKVSMTIDIFAAYRVKFKEWGVSTIKILPYSKAVVVNS